MAGKWTQEPVPSDFAAAWREQYPEVPPPRAFVRGGLTAFMGREPVVDGDWRWHLSIQGPGRVPTWEELVDATHELRPGVVFSVPLPPRSWWVNFHPHVLHVWETRDEHLVSEWRSNQRGDRPT